MNDELIPGVPINSTVLGIGGLGVVAVVLSAFALFGSKKKRRTIRPTFTTSTNCNFTFTPKPKTYLTTPNK